jgi:hypothetical protein
MSVGGWKKFTPHRLVWLMRGIKPRHAIVPLLGEMYGLDEYQKEIETMRQRSFLKNTADSVTTVVSGLNAATEIQTRCKAFNHPP